MSDVYFARVKASGEITGDIINVSVSTGKSDQPTLAWTGSEFGIAWREDRYIMLALLSDSGEKVHEDTLMAPSGYMPYLAWSGSDFGLTYVSFWEVYFKKISF